MDYVTEIETHIFFDMELRTMCVPFRLIKKFLVILVGLKNKLQHDHSIHLN